MVGTQLRNKTPRLAALELCRALCYGDGSVSLGELPDVRMVPFSVEGTSVLPSSSLAAGHLITRSHVRVPQKPSNVWSEAPCLRVEMLSSRLH